MYVPLISALIFFSAVVDCSIFNFDVENLDGSLSLSSFKGKKAYLVVNVASQCGLTDRNYDELQQLYDVYSSQGLEILAFPCNNFRSQEPGLNEDIVTFARNKGAEFPVLNKLDCGSHDEASPLYQYLTNTLGGGLWGKSLKWNFHKFLCDADGIPIKRFGPLDNPLSLVKDVVALLEQ